MNRGRQDGTTYASHNVILVINFKRMEHKKRRAVNYPLSSNSGESTSIGLALGKAWHES